MNVDQEVDRILLQYYTPGCVLVNESMEILEYRGNTRAFLAHFPGKATLNILNMVPPDIAQILEGMSKLVQRTSLPHESNELEINFQGNAVRFRLQVFLLEPETALKNYLVVFNTGPIGRHIVSAPTQGFVGYTPVGINQGPAQETVKNTSLQNTATGAARKEQPEMLLRAKLASLQAENLKLKEYNDELLQLSYVSSHDLQEPMRKILIYSDLVMKRLKENISSEGIDYISKISNASRHMSHLINDMLDYTYVSRSDEVFLRTDLNAVVRKLLDDLGPVIREKQAKVEVGPLPAAASVTKQMEQLFYHLISNALKFSHPKRRPEITITAQKLSDRQLEKYKQEDKTVLYYHIIVADNGIGFSQQYASRIFTLFQRLHNKERYPGTGIGLALCRKIIMNHKGDIYAVSKENEGTTMHVILPAKQP